MLVGNAAQSIGEVNVSMRRQLADGVAQERLDAIKPTHVDRVGILTAGEAVVDLFGAIGELASRFVERDGRSVDYHSFLRGPAVPCQIVADDSPQLRPQLELVGIAASPYQRDLLSELVEHSSRSRFVERAEPAWSREHVPDELPGDLAQCEAGMRDRLHAVVVEVSKNSFVEPTLHDRIADKILKLVVELLNDAIGIPRLAADDLGGQAQGERVTTDDFGQPRY